MDHRQFRRQKWEEYQIRHENSDADFGRGYPYDDYDCKSRPNPKPLSLSLFPSLLSPGSPLLLPFAPSPFGYIYHSCSAMVLLLG